MINSSVKPCYIRYFNVTVYAIFIHVCYIWLLLQESLLHNHYNCSITSMYNVMQLLQDGLIVPLKL